MAESYSKWVENTVGKGEIARYEQFLLLAQCFQKACFPGASKGVIVWEWVNPLPGVLCGSVVKCLTGNPVSWVRAALDPLGFFVGVSLGKTLKSPSLALVKPRKM